MSTASRVLSSRFSYALLDSSDWDAQRIRRRECLRRDHPREAARELLDMRSVREVVVARRIRRAVVRLADALHHPPDDGRVLGERHRAAQRGHEVRLPCGVRETLLEKCARVALTLGIGTRGRATDRIE